MISCSKFTGIFYLFIYFTVAIIFGSLLCCLTFLVTTLKWPSVRDQWIFVHVKCLCKKADINQLLSERVRFYSQLSMSASKSSQDH